MGSHVRVDLHCHSSCSDGQLAPDLLARRLAADGVRFAALTDHESVEGLAAFRDALGREGVGFIAGIELQADSAWGTVHLLAYGFDPLDAALVALIAAGRRAGRSPEAPAVGVGLAPAARSPGAREVIRVMHEARGRVFLAHPWAYTREPEALEALVVGLQAEGLDGLEAYYALYSEADQLRLVALAERHGLLASGGTDFHRDEASRPLQLGVDLPEAPWRRFRDSLLAVSARSASPPPPLPSPPPVASGRRQQAQLDRRRFGLRVLLPTLLAMVLFVAPILLLVVPAFEDALISRKQEMIRELTNSAWSILAEHHADELAGRLSREEAQRAALSRIEFLRYGKDAKDYYWVTDMHPRMLMHPYRTDLNGQDLSDFRDPNGARVFISAVRLVRERQEGYLEYVWQWKDDRSRMAPKQSYVRGFAPWGWVIGTGLYVEDVHAETSAFTGRVLAIFAAVVALVAALLLIATLQSLRIERRRSAAEDALRQSHEKYRSLAEASLDAMMVVLDGRPTYANQTLLAQLGYEADHLGLLDFDEIVTDVVVEGPEPVTPAAWLAAALATSGPPPVVEARLRKRDGGTLAVHLSLERVTLGERPGVVIVAKDLSTHKALLAALDERQEHLRTLLWSLRAGALRVAGDRRLTVLEANPAATTLLEQRPDSAAGPVTLAELVGDDAAFDELRRELLGGGPAAPRVLRLRGLGPAVVVSLFGIPVPNLLGQVNGWYLVVEERHAAPRLTADPHSGDDDLGAPLMALDEPVRQVMRALPRCELGATVREAAALMADRDASVLLVTGPVGEGLGVLTDTDLRRRVLAADLDRARPIHEVMSAPVHTVTPSALGYEALALMHERGVGHLVIRDELGAIHGVVGRRDLLELDRYPLALLTSALHTATRLEDLFGLRQRLLALIKPLTDAGAPPRHIGRAITAVSDALTQRFIAFAILALGPPPARFAFIALGSEGREEQTLLTDQDNAIVYDAPRGVDEAPIHRYFLALGERVCGWLERAGLPLCKGQVMASNPRWCASLQTWESYFGAWVRVTEPQNLLEFSTFFDFRCVHGDADLSFALRRHVAEWLAETPSFFVHLAQNTTQQKPPLSFFGHIVAEADPRGGARGLNLKDAMAPIVSFSRLYALRGDLAETNTFDRLGALRRRGLLSADTFAEASLAYGQLMALRLRHQAECFLAGEPLSNQLNLDALTEIERVMLKQVLVQVALLQKKVAFDFLGGA